MFDYADFLTKNKCMLIAPAGYGKTHTIVEALKHCLGGKQLILTHTHAGIASIMSKIKGEQIPSSRYHIETICGFAQKYVLAFYATQNLPLQNTDGYYNMIIKKGIALFNLKPVQNILKHSFTGLFVDEYQDCSEDQHELVSAMSAILPTRILGDHLQGIFDFKGQQLIDMQSVLHMTGFNEAVFELDIPQRWLRGNNEQLGYDLKAIRAVLLQSQPINFGNYSSIINHQFAESDLYSTGTDYYRKINQLLSENSVLFLHPDSTSVHPRIKLNKLFKNRMIMLESIDDKDFYSLSKLLDLATPDNAILVVRDVCLKLFNKTPIGNWFNDKGLKNKTSPKDKLTIEPIKKLFAAFTVPLSYYTLAAIIKAVTQLPEVQCNRKELYNCLFKALINAEIEQIPVYESMVLIRNSIRRQGRRVIGKCIGTTLLTKGLEFDTVVLINAHKFESPKHLYVALTRASKKLVVFSESAVLSPKYL